MEFQVTGWGRLDILLSVLIFGIQNISQSSNRSQWFDMAGLNIAYTMFVSVITTPNQWPCDVFFRNKLMRQNMQLLYSSYDLSKISSLNSHRFPLSTHKAGGDDCWIWSSDFRYVHVCGLPHCANDNLCIQSFFPL